MPLRIVDKPSADPVSLIEAKAQLRVTDSANDALIKVMISAATKQVQSIVQRVFMEQTLEWVLSGWRSSLEIPVAPVVAADGINSIKYVDWSSQTPQELDKSLYVVQTWGDSVRIFPKFGTVWPTVFAYSSEPVVVNFTAGYESAGDVPENVKVAILLQLRHLWTLGETNLALRRDLVIGVGEQQFGITPELATIIPDAVRNLVLSEVW